MIKKCTLFALAVLLIGTNSASSVIAADIPATITPATIQNSCIEAQGALQRVLRTDVVTRVNRGQEYNSMLKLVQSFNARLQSNSLDATTFVDIQEVIASSYSLFTSNFLKYNDSMERTIRIDCRQQPQDFYDELTATRSLRKELTKNVGQMDVAIDRYKTAVSDLEKQLSGVNGSN